MDATADDPRWERFTLLGGPLHRLGERVGLVRGSRTFAFGVALGLSLWLVAAVLAWHQGLSLASLSMLGAHVRLLVAIPLLFLAETLLDPRLNDFMQVMVRSRVVPGRARDALVQRLARVKRWANSRWPDLACLAIAIGLLWLLPTVHVPGMDRTLRLGEEAVQTASGVWYSVVCLTVLRFLLLRWVLRLLLWWHCLWFVSRLPLRLVPAHADGVAGLGGLDSVNLHFAPLVLAISATMAASFAVDIRDGAMTLTQVIPDAFAILLLDAAIFLGPSLVFVPALWACKLKGQSDYMVLAERYAADFEHKWMGPAPPPEPLLGSSDIQSLADLSTAVQVVRDLRVVPVSNATLLHLGVLALLPLAPLALFKYPMADLARQVLGRLLGL